MKPSITPRALARGFSKANTERRLHIPRLLRRGLGAAECIKFIHITTNLIYEQYKNESPRAEARGI